MLQMDERDAEKTNTWFQASRTDVAKRLLL